MKSSEMNKIFKEAFASKKWDYSKFDFLFSQTAAYFTRVEIKGYEKFYFTLDWYESYGDWFITMYKDNEIEAEALASDISTAASIIADWVDIKFFE